MEKYNTISRMLLHIQHIEYTVVQAAHTLKKHHHVEYYHEMHLHISKMIHFTQHVREYFFYHMYVKTHSKQQNQSSWAKTNCSIVLKQKLIQNHKNSPPWLRNIFSSYK